MMHISVVYSSDNLYAQHVGVSMISLFENNKTCQHIDIYLIESKLSSEHSSHLKWICEMYHRSITFIAFDDIANKLKLDIGNSISMNAYARLFLCSALKDRLDKVLYLDCDSIINNSLGDLWNMDISDYYAAGVGDTVSDQTKLKINLSADSPYINSGMLLINLQRWREEGIQKKFEAFIDAHNGQVFHHDQGTINGVLYEKILLLHPKYNAMTPFFTMSREEIMHYYGLRDYYSEAELDEAMHHPVFIHLTPAFVNRPWVKGSKHPLVSLYNHYLDMTPWKGSDLWEDHRGYGEKAVSLLFRHLPFKMAHKICKIMF